jgi:hypothetical protein
MEKLCCSQFRPETHRPDTIHLTGQMSRANPLWGAPRIHGELLKIGLAVAQRTVAKYMIPRVRRCFHAPKEGRADKQRGGHHAEDQAVDHRFDMT